MQKNSMFFFSKKLDFLTLLNVLEITGSRLQSGLSSNDMIVRDVASLSSAKTDDISFYSNPKYAKFLGSTAASFCFIKDESVSKLNPKSVPILSDNPQSDFNKVLVKFYGTEELQTKKEGFIAETSNVHETAKIGKNVRILENVVVSDGAIIDDNVTIMPNSFIGNNVKIGQGTIIHDCCSIMFSHIGENCVIRSGARIGTSGFGFLPDTKTGNHQYIPQISGVIIGNNVDIGANSAVDRGCLEDTVISDNVKIDNLVQIGHGVKIGRSTFVSGQSGISGSAEIGKFVFMGGQVGVAGHIKVADFCQIAGQSGIMKEIKEPGSVMAGTPAILKKYWQRSQMAFQKLVYKQK